MSNPVLAVTIITLSHFDNVIIAAANNGINGFGSIGEGNLSYMPMLEASLISEDGKAIADSLPDALLFEVNKRIEAGTFT